MERDIDAVSGGDNRQLRKGWLSYKNKKRITPWLFVAPCVIVILLVTIFPTIYSFGLSFTKWEISLPNRPFIGFQNYVSLFRDARFRNSILITAIVVVVGVGVEMVLGFGLGQILSVKMKGKRIFVAALLLPVMVMPVVVG